MVLNFHKIIPPYNSWKWIFFALGIKFLMFLFFYNEGKKNLKPLSDKSYLAISTFDTWSYILPVENLMDGKGYSAKTTEGKYIPYAYRLPGFVPVYGPFYFIAGRKTAMTIFILLQIIFDAISVYLLAKTSYNIFNSSKAFFITFMLYSASSFVSIYNHYFLSESFSVSFIIFSIYFFIKARKENPERNYFLAGLFITMSFLLRPIAILYIVILFFIIVIFYKEAVQKIRYAVFFLLMFFCFELIWCVRNYIQFKKFYPLSSIFSSWSDSSAKIDFIDYYSPQYTALRDLINAVGGDIQRWGKNPEMKWFVDKNNHSPIPENFTRLYPLLNADSLLRIKDCYLKTGNRITLSEDEKHCTDFTVRYIHNFISFYKTEKKMDYYFLSRLKHMKRFLFPRMIPDFPFPKFEQMKRYQKLIKGGYYIFFLVLVITGLGGMVLAFLKKNLSMIQIAFLPLSIIAILSWLGSEPRYFAAIYPFFIVFLTYFILLIYNFWDNVKLNSMS